MLNTTLMEPKVYEFSCCQFCESPYTKASYSPSLSSQFVGEQKWPSKVAG